MRMRSIYRRWHSVVLGYGIGRNSGESVRFSGFIVDRVVGVKCRAMMTNCNLEVSTSVLVHQEGVKIAIGIVVYCLRLRVNMLIAPTDSAYTRSQTNPRGNENRVEDKQQ